ncbi:MAG TPA: (d)CMP kinase [Bacillales bacterium]|nr:(d)CMP kinase [Bacillales bacterium]
MREHICIAIDGPAAAGKSTVAKLVARRLSYVYIDTGAMYRALTLKVLEHHLDPENGDAIRELLANTEIELIPAGQNQKVTLDGKNVTESIRTEEVSNKVSFVAKHEEVRDEMVKRQRELAEDGGVVMDGRDIGTHVLPNAEVKVFLSASVEIRAERRHQENLRKGLPSDLEQMKRDIALRDKRDSERKTAPLMKADNAVEIDTSHLTIEQAVEKIMGITMERIG